MPTGVKMYVRSSKGLSPAQLSSLREDFMEAMSLTRDDFYDSGPLIVVAEEDRRHLPKKDEGSLWLDVNLWKSYYGPGYERGNADLFVRSADWLEQRLQDSEIYYGHDVNDENISLFDKVARRKLLDLLKASESTAKPPRL